MCFLTFIETKIFFYSLNHPCWNHISNSFRAAVKVMSPIKCLSIIDFVIFTGFMTIPRNNTTWDSCGTCMKSGQIQHPTSFLKKTLPFRRAQTHWFWLSLVKLFTILALFMCLSFHFQRYSIKDSCHRRIPTRKFTETRWLTIVFSVNSS